MFPASHRLKSISKTVNDYAWLSEPLHYFNPQSHQAKNPTGMIHSVIGTGRAWRLVDQLLTAL